MSNDNQTALEYYKKGVLCYQKRDLDGAMSNWVETIRHQPDHVPAIENLGIVYRAKGNIEAALKCLNQAIHFAPDKPSLYYNRALVYVDKNDFPQAIADYTQALTIDPKHPDAHCNRGSLYFKLGETQKARADLTVALQLNPHDQIAQKLVQMINQMPDVEAIVADALPDIQQGNLEKAWLKLQVAYQYGGKTNAKVHVGFGAIYEQQQAFEKAFAAFDYAISCDSSLPQAYNNRGRISLIVGDLESALSDFKQTVRLQPDNARGYYNIGGVYLQRNQPEKAVGCFNEAIKLGYAPAKQALSEAQKQIGKTVSPKEQKNLMSMAQADQKDLIKCILLLAKFAYIHSGPSQWVSVIGTSSFLGFNKKDKTKMKVFWGTIIEELNEFNKDGSSGSRMGATLEVFTPATFMVRITQPQQETYQLSFYMKRKVAGISQDMYAKQEEHTWLLPYEMLAPKLTELVETGVIKKNEHGLIYP